MLVSINVCLVSNMYMWDFYYGRCIKQKMGVFLAYEGCVAKKIGLDKKEREAFYNLRPIPTPLLKP
jgi:hypothetical protein